MSPPAQPLRTAWFGALFFIAVLALPVTSKAWGPQGHQTIATLAQEQLSPATRKAVQRLLAQEPGQTLVSISTWADENRSSDTAAWHYVNFPRGTCTFNPPRDCPQRRCVVDAIAQQLKILGSNAPEPQRLVALKYVVHLMADVHQPLHAGHYDDKGGNTYQLQVAGRGSNLHALWDSGLMRFANPSNSTRLQRLRAMPWTPSERTASATEAAQESCQIVGKAGFYPARQVAADYFLQFTPVMEQRLALAAARLANALNQTLRLH